MIMDLGIFINLFNHKMQSHAHMQPIFIIFLLNYYSSISCFKHKLSLSHRRLATKNSGGRGRRELGLEPRFHERLKQSLSTEKRRPTGSKLFWRALFKLNRQCCCHRNEGIRTRTRGYKKKGIKSDIFVYSPLPIWRSFFLRRIF